MDKEISELKEQVKTLTSRLDQLANQPKDKPKTKRPLNKYQQFMKEKLPEYKEKHPDKSQKELMAMCVDEWNKAKQ